MNRKLIWILAAWFAFAAPAVSGAEQEPGAVSPGNR